MTNSWKLFFPAAICILTAASYAAQNTSKSNRGASKSAAPQTARQVFDGYQKWRLVNAEPLYIPRSIAILCAPPAGRAQSGVGSHPSNEGKYIRVFVNAKGRTAMFTPMKAGAKQPHFPVGSVIVKQKLTTKESRAPELLTVMVKEKAGYDARNGDWRYLVVNGSGSKIYPTSNMSNCQACHAQQKDADYTFRSYLPAS